MGAPVLGLTVPSAVTITHTEQLGYSASASVQQVIASLLKLDNAVVGVSQVKALVVFLYKTAHTHLDVL